MLVNGTLTNCEIWPPISEKHMKSLEDMDIKFFVNTFQCNPHTNKVIYYLETGKLPFPFIIAKRRLMYLWHILSRDTGKLIRKVYDIQQISTGRDDFFEIIQKEKKKYDIQLHDNEISALSKNRFKKVVNESVNKFAFSWLLKKARAQSKCEGIVKNLKSDTC